jgi:AraC-like DNA-binding protein
MGLMEKVETTGIAPADRLAYWNDLVDRIFTGTWVNTSADYFDAELWRWKVGDLAMARPRCNPSQVGRVPKVDEERIVLHLQHRGVSRQHQFGCETEMGPGDFSLCSANHPYAFDLATAHDMLVVEFPRALIEGRVRNLDDQLGKSISGASPGGRIFHDFLLSLWRQGDLSDVDQEWQSGVNRAFADLIGLAVNGAGISREMARGSALRDRLVALIDARLCDPELRTATIADDLGVSARTVQNVFAAMGATPSSYVLDQRLQRAADRLSAGRCESITDIAFEVGFNDSAYFARCFRQRFGMTPREWRGGEASVFDPPVSPACGPVRASPVGLRDSPRPRRACTSN